MKLELICLKKLLFVLNPLAGTKKAAKYLTDIVAVFNRAGYDVTVYITDHQGDCTQAVRRLAEAMDLIVCCGGDGTFNETVTGILQSGADVPVGYIPAGSTNDFARSLNLESDFVKAAEQITKGTEYQYDIGLFGSRHFTYIASFGVFTRTSYSTPQNLKNALGHTAYVLSGIQELGQIKPVRLCVTLDGEELRDDFIFGAVCNSTSLAGILTLSPKHVDMSDGLFEVLLIRPPKDLADLSKCIQALTKQTYDSPMITFRSASCLQIRAETELPWSLDGEREDGSQQVTIQNLHRAIRLVK